MKSVYFLGVVSYILLSCNVTKTASSSLESVNTASNYRNQLQNLDQVVYFRAAGNEPFWSLKISESGFQFSYFTTKLQTFNAPMAAPVAEQDANVKKYRVVTASGQLNIQITQNDCKDSMTGIISPYTVEIELKLGDAPIFTTYKGCGDYITDARLSATWVLEKMNGKLLTSDDFSLGFPRIELDTKINHFYGFAGCNGMSGSIFFEKEVLKFNKIATTRKMCQTQNREADFIKILQSTNMYEISNNQLILKNNSSDELVFKKVD